jgi:hypothetical protein
MVGITSASVITVLHCASTDKVHLTTFTNVNIQLQKNGKPLTYFESFILQRKLGQRETWSGIPKLKDNSTQARVAKCLSTMNCMKK